MPIRSESEFENTTNETGFRRGVTPNDNKNFQIKDIIVVLLFLGAIVSIYININERLVKLETKGEVIVQQLIELKSDVTKSITKVDDTLRNLQNQVRDLEILMMNKNRSQDKSYNEGK